MTVVEATELITFSRKLSGMIEKVVTTFAATWKTALRNTDKEIVQLFSNYRQVRALTVVVVVVDDVLPSGSYAI